MYVAREGQSASHMHTIKRWGVEAHHTRRSRRAGGHFPQRRSPWLHHCNYDTWCKHPVHRVTRKRHVPHPLRRSSERTFSTTWHPPRQRRWEDIVDTFPYWKQAIVEKICEDASLGIFIAFIYTHLSRCRQILPLSYIPVQVHGILPST